MDPATPATRLFCELAALSTPSGHERAAADHCRGYLERYGVVVDEDATGSVIGSDAGNLYARLAPTADGTPVFFCAHLDTVPPTAAIEPVTTDGVIRNRHPTILGADNKASVAAMLDAVRNVVEQQLPHAGIELVLTTQEEVGLRGAKAFDTSRLVAGTGFVYDHAGPLGGIVMQAPGQNTIDLEFTGLAAHAGIAPADGRNAIAAAARAIAAMRLGRIDEATTANVGVISGGVARNIVAPSCNVRAEVRSRDSARLAEETQALVDAAALGAGDCSVATSVRREYSAYRFSRTDPVVALARRALRASGYAPRDEAVGGGADAHIFNERGVPCVVLTSGMQNIHTPDEQIAASDIDGMVAITLAVIANARVAR
jgi:tripeptide aminopeptidase